MSTMDSKEKRMKILLSVLVTLLPMVAVAHHGHTNQFDAERTLEITGVVTGIKFVNPHSFIRDVRCN